MATTKQVLRLQSDQLLDGPTIGAVINLKNLLDTRRLRITWVQPAVDPSDVLFKDPGALGDAVVYENLAQTLKNKNLSDPSNTPPFDPTVAHLPGQAGGQTLNGGTLASQNLVLRSTAHATKGSVQIDLDDLVMGLNKNIVFSGTGEPNGLPATPAGATSATSKAYVDTQISSISGGVAAWKELLLSGVQLDNANKAIAQADAFFLTALPTAGDTFSIKDSTPTLETWTFQAVAGVLQPAIGGSAVASMTNLAARINIDSTKWSASFVTTLASINAPGVVIIYRKVPTATVTDRIFGTFASGGPTYINYGGLATDYRSNVTAALPGADPATNTFGISRITAALIPDEAHLLRAEDSAQVWNDDLLVWQLIAGASVTATSAPGGGIQGVVTADENLGLKITAGIAKVFVDPAGALVTSATGLAAQVDTAQGVQISANKIAAKVDGVSVVFDGLGNIKSTPVALNPIGTVSFAALLTQNINSPTTVPGTAAVTNLVASVAGTGTAWLTSLYNGASIQFSNQIGTFYTILSVVSDVSLLLTVPFTGATNGAVTISYVITPPISGVVSADIPTQRYQDATVQGQFFDFVVPEDYDNGPISVLAAYQMSTAVAANVRIRTQAKIVKGGGTVDTTTFPLAGSTITPPVTTNFTRSTLLSITSGTFAKGDTIQFYFVRAGNDTADAHTGEMVVVAFEVSYTGQVATRAAVQSADVFGPVSGFPGPAVGAFNADIPTANYSNAVDQAAAAYFIVPDTWDGVSDAYVRVQYALATAAAGNIDLRTSGNVADVVSGATNVIPSFDGIFAVTADTNPHRTSIIRSIPAALLSKGSFIELAIQRFTATPGNSAAVLQVLNVTLTFGVVPVSGFVSVTTSLLAGGVFGNTTGTVSGTIDYPNIAGGEYEGLYDMTSLSAAGRIDVAFPGALAPTQTTISEISVPLMGTGATPQYHIQVYAEGTVGTVYDSLLQTAPGTLTTFSILSPSLSAQPTGGKHYIVVVQAFIDAGEAILVGRPLVTQQ